MQNRVFCRPMVEWLKQLAYALSLRLKSRARLEAENLVLRQQLNVLIRKLPKRLRLTNSDRLLLVWLYQLRWHLRSGVGAIIDATYMESGERAKVRDLARQMAMPILFVECAISDAEAKARLDARARQSDAVSDATWEIYLQHKAAFAPFATDLPIVT